jgi:hypothetical protein
MPINKAGHYVGAKGQRGPPGPAGEGFVKTVDGNFDVCNKRLINLKTQGDQNEAVNVEYLQNLLQHQIKKSLPDIIPYVNTFNYGFKRKRLLEVSTDLEKPELTEVVNFEFLSKQLANLKTYIRQHALIKNNSHDTAFSCEGLRITNLKTENEVSEAANTSFVEKKLQKLRDISVLLFEDGTENTTATQYVTNKIRKEIESLKENIEEQVNTALKPTLEKLQRIKEDTMLELEVQIIKDIMYTVKQKKGETLNEGELPNLTESLQEFIEMVVTHLPHSNQENGS